MRVAIPVALIQMDLAFGQPEANRRRAEALIREAAARGARWVVLPELWTTAYDLPRLGAIADDGDQPTGPLLSRLARELGIAIFGSVAERRPDGIYNTLRVYGPDGSLAAAYDKIHLVPMLDEPRYLAPGRSPALARVDGVTVGLLICYDLRFPELSRGYALAGAEVLVVPAQWPAVRRHHWRTLAIARAIENQCYLLGCNRAGAGGGTRFDGGSLVVDPWGEVLAEGGPGEAILYAEIDPARVAAVRAEVPVFRDRRPEAYRFDGLA
ncbi:MAG: carbon-nitrogen family hydrolase [Firmicutes bacterium]|nr:carbon-nitrogen family hydrolase [Bacillota bacterium]